MTSARAFSLLTAVGTLVLIGCSKDEGVETTAPQPVVTQGAEAQAAPAVKEVRPESVAAKQPQSKDPSLEASELVPVGQADSDGQIIRVLEVVNTGEIAQAQVARDKA